MNNPELFAAILANPLDDAPRLAYAKWLKSNGDQDRAEFIKVQCDRAAKERFDPAQERLKKREKTLLNKHQAKWLAELPEWARQGAKFRRGFVGTVGVDLTELVKRFAKLVKITPVDGIELSISGADAESVQALAECPQAAQLTELYLWHNDVTNAGAKAIATSPHFANLKSLQLGSVGLTDPAVKALARSPSLAGLTELNLSSNKIKADGVKAILGSSWKLKTLTLHGVKFDTAAMTALARWEGLESVVELGLGNCGIGPEGAKALAASPHLGNLRILDLSGSNSLTAVGVEALLHAPWAKNLVELHLQASGLDNAAGLVIARAPKLPHLKQLYIMNNRFEDESRQELIERYGSMVVPD